MRLTEKEAIAWGLIPPPEPPPSAPCGPAPIAPGVIVALAGILGWLVGLTMGVSLHH